MTDLQKGLRLFARDMRENVPLLATFILACVAFFLAFAVASGFHF